MKIFRRKRHRVIGVILVLAVALWVVVSLTLLNEEWLKGRIVKYVRENYQADVTIESLEFDAWKGHALLSGINLVRNEKDNRVSADIDSIELDIRLLPLIFREVAINKLVMSKPQVKINVVRKPEVKTGDSLVRIEKIIAGVTYELIVSPVVDSMVVILKVFTGDIKNIVTIKELIVHDGSVGYTAERDGAESFAVDIEDFEYSARDINAMIPMDFVYGADISAKLTLDESEAGFSQQFSERPYTLSITDVDLGYVDRYLKQKDILQVNNGTANVNFFVDNNIIRTQVAFEGLELSQNPNAAEKDFVFIGTEKLIDHVNQNSGNMNFEFEMANSSIRTSEDLEFCAVQAWEGMWKQIFKKVSSEKVKQFKEKATEGIINFLNKKKRREDK